MPQYEKHQLARNIHTFFENVPQEQPHPYPFGFDYWDAVKLIEPQLDDPARVERAAVSAVAGFAQIYGGAAQGLSY